MTIDEEIAESERVYQAAVLASNAADEAWFANESPDTMKAQKAAESELQRVFSVWHDLKYRKAWGIG